MTESMLAVLAVIPPPPTDGFQIGPLFIHIYGVAIALGVLAAFWLTNRRWRAAGRDPAELEPILLWSVLAGFIGGRVGYVIPRVGTFDPWWEVIAIWQGGLALYGGLTLGVGTGLVLAWRRGIPPLVALDVAIPAIPLAQMIGRWGNYFNQELFGTPTTLPWALEVEPAFRPAQYAEFSTFHPTFLYESLYNALVVVALLWLSRNARLRPGSLALGYGVLYGTGRFALELIRTDTTFRLLGLSRNAWVSIIVVTGCLALLWWREVRRGGPDDPVARRTTATAEPGGDPDGGTGGTGAASGETPGELSDAEGSEPASQQASGEDGEQTAEETAAVGAKRTGTGSGDDGGTQPEGQPSEEPADDGPSSRS